MPENYLNYRTVPSNCPNCGKVTGTICIIAHYVDHERRNIAISARVWCPKCHDCIEKLHIIDP